MKKFNNLIDLVQVFANEYTLPGSTVLCLGFYDPQIETLFKFIDTNVIFVNETPVYGFHIISSYNSLPFENHSFDLILNFTDQFDLFDFIKPSGKILTKGEILNGVEYHYCKEIFTVI